MIFRYSKGGQHVLLIILVSIQTDGMAARHAGLVMTSHEGIDLCEVEDVLHRRLADAPMNILCREEQTVAMSRSQPTQPQPSPASP
jgi:hypothetical protein